MGWIYLLIALAILTGVLVLAFIVYLLGMALETFVLWFDWRQYKKFRNRPPHFVRRVK